jgi:hypothetical protein
MLLNLKIIITTMVHNLIQLKKILPTVNKLSKLITSS